MDAEVLGIRELGLIDYQTAWQAMQRFTNQRGPQTGDELWLLQHPPVFTQGQAGKAEHVLFPGDIPVVQVDRGGQVTYHGPGQLVCYLLIDVRRRGIGVRALVSHIEQSLVDLLASYGVAALAKPDAPGVYVDGAKIASLGLRIRNGRSFHGLGAERGHGPGTLPAHQSLRLCGAGDDTAARSDRAGGLLRSRRSTAHATGPAPRIRATEDPRGRNRKHMSTVDTAGKRPAKVEAGVKLRGAEKVARIPVKIIPTDELPKKPDWIRVRIPVSPEVDQIKSTLRKHKLHSVCEEASCPNLGECFSSGTATFMIMGDICTRRCPFCDVGHGRPNALDPDEPKNLAQAIADMRLKYVVITSVDRDDLRDGGAQHFADCLREIRKLSPNIQLETLVPDYRGRMDIALNITASEPPDVFNHNLETVPRLYKSSRPGSDFEWSLDLLEKFKQRVPGVPTKSGLMLGLGETDEEVIETMQRMREHDIDMLTLGQYLQPSRSHLPVQRFVHPDTFAWFAEEGMKMGFKNIASGPLVRSSYHADQQAHAAKD